MEKVKNTADQTTEEIAFFIAAKENTEQMAKDFSKDMEKVFQIATESVIPTKQEIEFVFKDTIRIEKTEYDRLMKQSVLLDVLLRMLFSEPVGKNCTVFDARRLAKAVVGESECKRVSADLGKDGE